MLRRQHDDASIEIRSWVFFSSWIPYLSSAFSYFYLFTYQTSGIDDDNGDNNAQMEFSSGYFFSSSWTSISLEPFYIFIFLQTEMMMIMLLLMMMIMPRWRSHLGIFWFNLNSSSVFRLFIFLFTNQTPSIDDDDDDAQMEIDIREITRQRDVARAQLDDLMRTVGDDQESIHQVLHDSFFLLDFFPRLT